MECIAECWYCNSCCATYDETINFTSDIAKTRRRKAQRLYGTLAAVQRIVGGLAVVSGATTIGIAIPNPAFPLLNFLPFATGVLVVYTACLLTTVARADLDNQVSRPIRARISVHLIINSLCIFLCIVSACLSVWGLTICFRTDQTDDTVIIDDRAKCQPMRDVRTAFTFLDAFLVCLLFATSMAAWLLFCRNRQHFDFLDGYQRVQRQIVTLRETLEDLYAVQRRKQRLSPSHQKQSAVTPPPPPLLFDLCTHSLRAHSLSGERTSSSPAPSLLCHIQFS